MYDEVQCPLCGFWQTRMTKCMFGCCQAYLYTVDDERFIAKLCGPARRDRDIADVRRADERRFNQSNNAD